MEANVLPPTWVIWENKNFTEHNPSFHFGTERIEEGHTKSLTEPIVSSSPGQTHTTFIKIKREKSQERLLPEIARKHKNILIFLSWRMGSSQTINPRQLGLKMESSPWQSLHWQDSEVNNLWYNFCYFLIEDILTNDVMVLVSLNNNVFESILIFHNQTKV